MSSATMRIGFDFDNTLVDYSNAAAEYAINEGMAEYLNLAQLREGLKNNGESEDSWQKAQSWIYTYGISLAKLSVGFSPLKEYLAEKGLKVFVVSHKTEKTPERFGAALLREFAIKWIQNTETLNFLELDKNLFFCETRDEKIRKIQELKLNFFIDDLVEVLTHEEFPKETRKILFNTNCINQDKTIERVSDMFDLKKFLQNEL